HCGTSTSCHAICTGCVPSVERPSSVVIVASPTVCTWVWHERTARPRTCTVQAPHWPMPQPNFVTFSPTASRMSQSRGISAGTSTVCDFPLIDILYIDPRGLYRPNGLGRLDKRERRVGPALPAVVYFLFLASCL